MTMNAEQAVKQIKTLRWKIQILESIKFNKTAQLQLHLVNFTE